LQHPEQLGRKTHFIDYWYANKGAIMGRKGTSKRKPAKTKSNPAAAGNGSVASVMKAAEGQSAKAGSKSTTERKKDSK
jgi:hypothetical protein